MDSGLAASSQNRFASKSSAALVAAGILLSRLAGLVRERVFAHYFGSSQAADAFKAAFKIPNLLQNLFGEGVLSASFIPVYAALLARGDEEEARRVAGAVLALLSLCTSALVTLGVVATPYFIDAIAPGFHGAERELTIRLVRILFPGAGLLVMSAWCLGILNSHRRFFLSYTAPVAWNAVMIATMIGFGRRDTQFDLATTLAWGSVGGSALQVGMQWPAVRKLVRGMRLSLEHRAPQVREVIRNFTPVFFSRGVVQISAYVDALLATLLPTGAVASLAYAQILYLLPVSLFGMSVSAAELPAMSGAVGTGTEVAAVLRRRLNTGLRQITFFVLPSAIAFLALGDVIVSAIFLTGAFRHHDVLYVWGALAGATIGLLASALGRLYSSTYYALRDTRNPLRYASVRVALTTALGYVAAFEVPGWIGVEARWGLVGLTASAGIAAWVEFTLLRRGLRARIGETGVPATFLTQIWVASLLAAAAGRGVFVFVGALYPPLAAVLVLGAFGAVYAGMAAAMRVPELHALVPKRIIIRR
ncbi:MAG TPA: murein biosynthesis integral membrane protein MurJ [Terriglobales bacterium]|nr:murein biosynthesis integral membrane protein MurJ [Terriglobales bacterium]